MAKAANKKEELKEEQAHIDANTADNTPIVPAEEPRKPEVKGKMSREDAIKVVNFYANVDVKGTPADLAEARKILAEK